MALTDNFGTQVYLISCFVPSSTGVKPLSNANSAYVFLSANSYILFGLSGSQMVQPSVNRGSSFYAPPCSATSLPLSNLNRGSQFYYSSAFNCVTFCDPIVIFKNTNLNY